MDSRLPLPIRMDPWQLSGQVRLRSRGCGREPLPGRSLNSIARIRRRPQRLSVPVIFLPTYGVRRLVRRGREERSRRTEGLLLPAVLPLQTSFLQCSRVAARKPERGPAGHGPEQIARGKGESVASGRSPASSEHGAMLWRSGRDSNPRYPFGVYSLSRGALSTTQPSLRAGRAAWPSEAHRSSRHWPAKRSNCGDGSMLRSVSRSADCRET